jgi:hypothetical protein
MKVLRQTFLVLFLGAQLAIAGNAIEFSADLKEFTGEGVIYRRLTFRDDQRTISYLPPQGWHCSIIGKNLHLRPVDKNFAAAEIESVALDKPTPLDDSVIATVTERVLNTLPPGSQPATLIKQEPNPLPFNNNTSYEVVISYRASGDTFQRGVLFVNTATSQLLFKLTAKKADFDALYRAFRSSIGTWEWH